MFDCVVVQCYISFDSWNMHLENKTEIKIQPQYISSHALNFKWACFQQYKEYLTQKFCIGVTALQAASIVTCVRWSRS